MGSASESPIAGRPRSRRWWRWLVNPWATASLAVVVGGLAWSAPDGTVAEHLRNLHHHGSHYGPPSRYVVRDTDGRLRWIDFEGTDSADELARAVSERPGDVYLARISAGRSRSGIFAHSAERYGAMVDFIPQLNDGLALSPTEEQTARVLAADWIIKNYGDAETATMIAYGPSETSRRLWGGVTVDVLGCTASALLPISLFWVPGALRALRESPAARRRRRGLCGRCGYPVVGLPAGRCPECGEPVAPGGDSEPTRAPGS